MVAMEAAVEVVVLDARRVGDGVSANDEESC